LALYISLPFLLLVKAVNRAELRKSTSSYQMMMASQSSQEGKLSEKATQIRNQDFFAAKAVFSKPCKRTTL
jgi:hypothetical protein